MFFFIFIFIYFFFFFFFFGMKTIFKKIKKKEYILNKPVKSTSTYCEHKSDQDDQPATGVRHLRRGL